MINTILKKHPHAIITRQTENGTLVQTDDTKSHYMVFPSYPAQNYTNFKLNNPFQFRAFMFYLGSLCRELNETIQNGQFDIDMNEEKNNDLYYATLQFKGKPIVLEHPVAHQEHLPVDIIHTSYFLNRYKKAERQYA